MSAKVSAQRQMLNPSLRTTWRAALKRAIHLACPQDWNAGVRAGLYRDLSAKIELAAREPPSSPMMTNDTFAPVQRKKPKPKRGQRARP